MAQSENGAQLGCQNACINNIQYVDADEAAQTAEGGP
jgi:hypothetical protein